jgi:hypothetical protein
MKIIQLCLLSFFLICSACSKAQRGKETIASTNVKPNPTPFKGFLGINAFEWDFSDTDNGVISPGKLEVIKSFGTFRHYLDWDKLEFVKGLYSFNPTRHGGWNYDMIYERCQQEGIEILSCIKGCSSWIIESYPKDQRDGENVPAPYGLSRLKPASYIEQAQVAFQFAARYGHNKNVPKDLVIVNSTPRWNEDPLNQVKIGLGYVNYVECDNERDKTWKGPKAYQSPEEYAANMSAFYDGHMGRLGKNVGVKTADPSMKVVIGGISNPDVNYIIKMIEWCRKNRGLKKNGTVNLCFDVINYHLYNNDWIEGKGSTTGKPPELSVAAKTADEFVSMSKKYANGIDVWITESGYDLNPGSPQRAPAIGKKSAFITQADWMLRSSFLYARHGLKRSFYYMLDDLDPKSPGVYASSGFSDNHTRRPVADYFYQTKKLMGDFNFLRNIQADPIIDVYGSGKRKIYVLYIPDEKGRTKAIKLDLGTATSAKLYTLKPGATGMTVKTVATINGKLPITVTETPVFVEKI